MIVSLALEGHNHLVLSAQNTVFVFQHSHELVALFVESFDFLG